MAKAQHNPTLPLFYLVRPAHSGEVQSPLVVLLHGYGANEEDLFSLADTMPKECVVISLRGPHILAEGHYAWFSLHFTSGNMVHDAAQAEASRSLLMEVVDTAVLEFNIDTTQIFLIGFSQGAIMSYSVALTYPGKVKGIAALSGRILEEIRPTVTRSLKSEALSVFIGHGTGDTVLPIRYAREARSYLETLGVKLVYNEYLMPHGISPEEQVALIKWLNKSLV